MIKLTKEQTEKLEKFASIKWQSPGSVPDVQLGGEKLFWLAVKSVRGGVEHEAVYLANYLNKPKVYNDKGDLTDECIDWLLTNDWEEEGIDAVGWFDSKAHPDYENWYEPINFNEDYVLLGWAEYNAPPFFTSEV